MITGMGSFNRKYGGEGGGSTDIIGFLLRRGSGISFGILLLLAGLSCGNFPVLDVDTNMRIVLVPYDTPVGTIIYRLRASDSDNNFPLSFEVLGSIGKSILSLRFLGCDQAESLCQADVVLKKALDKGRTYEFQLQVKDTDGDYTKVHSVITATQGTANFNPTFMPRIIHLDESTPVGTELEKFVIAKTLLNSRHVFLEIRDKGDRIALKQRLVSNNQTEGTLLLKKILDYETEPWFTFQLLAMNAYTNTTCDTRNILVSQVIVAVHDVQDTPPYFTSLPASVELKSSMRPGDLIATVSAEDGDKQNKRLIRYGFLTDSNPFVVFFNLDPMSGEIHLRRNLTELLTMAKPNEPIEMTIIAEEIIPDSGRLVGGKSSNGGKSSFYDNNSRAMGKITFWFGRDSSFGPADFSSDKYVGEVKENSVSGTLVHFGSVEPRVSHQHPKEIISLTLQPGGASNKIHGGRGIHNNINAHHLNSNSGGNGLEVAGFQVLPSQGSGNFSFEIRVSDSKLLDFERVTEFTFLVVAVTSCGMSSEAQVTIHIRDENDEAPVFAQSEYHVELPEHPPKGTRVLQVQATDKDTSGSYGKVTYSNLIGSNAFHLDPTTGEITVERPELIDRELEPEIRLYVEAKNGGYSDVPEPSASRNLATAVVVIKLTDKNDHAPKFFQKYYQAVLNPQHTELKEPLFVKAFDADEGVNSQIRYEVKDSRFFVDPLSGEFRLRGGFQRDPRDGDSPFLGTVRVYAHDLGSPKLTSETQVQLFAEEMVTREIQFVFPAPPDRIRKNKTNFEIMLSKLSGGVAHIQNVMPYHRYPRAGSQVEGGKSNGRGLEPTPSDPDDNEIPARFRQANSNNPEDFETNTALSRRSVDLASSTDKSLVTATVQYPVSSTPTRVDLSQIPNVYGNGGNELDGGGDGGGSGGGRPDTDKIKVYEAENRALFWILISFLLILLILFVVFLCCVYCPWCWLYGHCYSKGDKVGREHSGRSLLIEKRRPSDAHSRSKTYPEKIDDEEGDYDRDGYSRRPPARGPRHARREAWSGDDRKGAWRTSHQSPRSIRRYRGTPPPRSRKVGPAQPRESDVALEDWEFDGGPVRQRDQAEEIGSRWQLQQQQQPMQSIPQGSQIMPVAIPVANIPRRVAFGHPGQVPPDDGYMGRSQEIFMPDESQIPRGSYAMIRQPPQSLPAGPDERAMSHLQQRKTRFFRTETGEVLQFADYEGDEGKELLMKRYIDEQQPKELQQLQQQQSFGSQRISQTPGMALSQPRLDEISRAPEGGSVDRPKAAIVSRRHPKGISLSKDVTFEDDEDKRDESPPAQYHADGKNSKSRKSGSESEGDGAKREKDREAGQDDTRRHKRAGKETEKKQQRRPKSPTPQSEDESRRSRSPTRKSHRHPSQSQSHSKGSKKRSKSPSRSKTRSMSPPPQHKSKSKSPSRSKSRTRSRSATPPRYQDEREKRRQKAKQQQQTLDYKDGGRQHKLRRHHHIQQSKASSKGEGDYDRDYRSSHHHRLKHKADSKSFKDSREEMTREKSEKSLEPSLTSLPLSLRGGEDDETELPSGSTGAIGDEHTAKTSSSTALQESPSRTEQPSPPSIEVDERRRGRRRSSLFQQQSSEEHVMMNQSMVDINIIPPSSAMTDSSYNPRDEDRAPPEVEDEEERQETAISRTREESVEYESYQHHYGERDDDDDDADAATATGERRRIMMEKTDTLPEPTENEMNIASQSTLDIAEAEAAAVAVAPSDSVEVPPPDEEEAEAEERASGVVAAHSSSVGAEAEGDLDPARDRRVGGPEEDDDSGIGMAGYLSRRNKMLEKKSVFTIAYDEVAQSAAMRPDTRGSTAEATEPEVSASVIK